MMSNKCIKGDRRILWHSNQIVQLTKRMNARETIRTNSCPRTNLRTLFPSWFSGCILRTPPIANYLVFHVIKIQCRQRVHLYLHETRTYQLDNLWNYIQPHFLYRAPHFVPTKVRTLFTGTTFYASPLTLAFQFRCLWYRATIPFHITMLYHGLLSIKIKVDGGWQRSKLTRRDKSWIPAFDDHFKALLSIFWHKWYC